MSCFVAHMRDQSLSKFVNRGGGGMKLEGHRGLGEGMGEGVKKVAVGNVKNN